MNKFLSWSSVSGASEYEVWRRKHPYFSSGDLTATRIATSTLNSHLDAGRIGYTSSTITT